VLVAHNSSAGAIPRPSAVRQTSLAALGQVLGATLVGPDVAATGITASSQLVRPGDIFAALSGRTGHGAQFAPAAIAAGGVAVLTDPPGAAQLPLHVSALVVPDVRAVLGPAAAAVYGSPSRRLSVLGVTGTSGKTTTTFLIRAGLAAAGGPTALIGTVATLIGNDQISTGFTTPEAPELQALLAVMAERDVTTVAMEVSSHALALGRADGVDFAVGAFTNLSRDHLDFHADLDDYFEAKAKLFDGRSRVAAIVTDDEWGQRLAARVGPAAITVGTTGNRTATWRATDIVVRTDASTSFRAVGPGRDFAAGTAILGSYNVANALLALAVLDAVGVDPRLAAPAVAQAGVPGRMERVVAGQPFLVVVDYSHKPAAVEGALRALRPLTSQRLVIVLGCGGDRDQAKRPIMGEVAARYADVLIVTDDNPRSEDPAAIRRAMLDGAGKVPAAERAEVVEIGSRGAAIAAAIRMAGPGDTVLIAGKGHELGQEVAGTVYPFDDRDVARGVLTGTADEIA
jgi:UDP-N-acetylmuramoyl-L-alanyl-D-glutamate--2,6-diaminopimelate ligase